MVFLLSGVLFFSLPLHPQVLHKLSQASTYQYPIPNNLHDEISFCIADLKYDGTSIKICEFGEGLESRFKGYEALNKDRSIWSMLWSYLSTFNVPVWFTGKLKGSYDYDIKKFQAMGGTLIPNIHSIKSDDHFKQILKNHYKHPRRSAPAGIIALRSLLLHSSILEDFNAKYPHMILLGQTTNRFVRSKYQTNKLFECNELAQYKPKFKICTKTYASALANSIIKELGGDVFVIKPVDAALGHGVIMVEKGDLDETLRILFRDTNELERFKQDISYYYWKKDTKKFFIIEEYAPSKIIYINNEPYDPTMRVIFAMHNWAGNIVINFFDAYWKLPTKSLIAEGSLTEKHKSSVKSGGLCSLPVDYDDFEMVKALLSRALPELYLKMLLLHSHFNEPAV
jgi:hypothetical protein